MNTPVMQHGPVSNTLQDKSVDEIEDKEGGSPASVMDDNSAVLETSALIPGTLIEKTLVGHQSNPIIAVQVAKIGPYHVLCNTRGQISLELQPYSAFTYRNFITPFEFAPLVGALPKDLLKYPPNTFFDLPDADTTALTAPVVQKMMDFQKTVDTIYRDNAKKMDSLLSSVAHKTDHRYCKLPELAREVYGNRYHRGDHTYDPAAMYNIHLNLISGDLHAQPIVPPAALYTNEYFYEVPPLSAHADVKHVSSQVASYMNFKKSAALTTVNDQEEQELLEFSISNSGMGSFVTKAQKRIDAYRRGRVLEKPTEWTKNDLAFLRVIEMWAGYEMFSNRSKLHMLGPMLLRAVERYQDVFNLSQSVGWYFLKEVGWIPLWEVRARYKTLPPSVGAVPGGGFSRPTDNLDIKENITGDIWAGRRKKWDIPAFAIDSASTEFIDDAVSIEPGNKPSEWWMHVHVADPTSRIHPRSELARHAESLPLTVWMPLHHTSMIPYEWVGDLFSLGEGKICLTFSALLGEDGEILETEVTPGILGETVYMTPDQSNHAVDPNYSPLKDETKFAVGGHDGSEVPTRTLTPAEGLSHEHLKILQRTDEIAAKRKQFLLKHGAVPGFPPKAEVKGMLLDSGNGNGETDSRSDDPYIELRMSSTSSASPDYSPLVHQSMLTGCEAAAKWCAERNIPIPYLSHKYVKESDYPKVMEKLSSTIYPALSVSRSFSSKLWMALVNMIGWQTLGTTPGRFIFHGQEMYAKVTSPLRRYSDMLCHWQIHGWLKQIDSRSSPALAGSPSQASVVDLDKLPFLRDELDDEILPMLRVRERLIMQTTRNGNMEIALQALVRAWKFGETQLPDKFRFEVIQYSPARKIVRGRLDWFDIEAYFGRNEIAHVVEGVGLTDVLQMTLEEWDDGEEEPKGEEEEEDREPPDMLVQKMKGQTDTWILEKYGLKELGAHIRFQDLEPGDVLEVELKDVDVALRQVLVRPFKRVKVVKRQLAAESAWRSVNYW